MINGITKYEISKESNTVLRRVLTDLVVEFDMADNILFYDNSDDADISIHATQKFINEIRQLLKDEDDIYEVFGEVEISTLLSFANEITEKNLVGSIIYYR